MAITEPATDLRPIVGEAAGTALPADEAWSIGDEGSFPEGETAAVGAQVGDHIVAFVVTDDLARRIQVGPPPAEDLLTGMRPALDAVAQALGLGEPQDLIEMNAQALAGDLHPDSVLVGLLDGGTHHVTVVVTQPEMASEPVGPEMEAASFQPIVGGPAGGAAASGLEVLHEVKMGVTVELGRTLMPLRDILAVVPGAVIELDRAASAPVDVLVNGTLIARGEVVVIDEEFGIRVTEVVGADQSANGHADQ